VETIKLSLLELLQDLKKQGKTIATWGAAAKATTFARQVARRKARLRAAARLEFCR
jgi:C-methyltransferase C-terminal domain